MQEKFSPVWECPKGCDLSKGVVCPHLERLLPHPTMGIRPVYLPDMNIPLNRSSYDPQEQPGDEVSFVRSVEGYALEPFQVEILVDRLVNCLSFRQIARERGYTGHGSVIDIYLNAVRALKERGWRPRR